MPTWKDIDLTLNADTNGDIKSLTDEDAVKSSLLNIIQTLKGSRRMLPEFAVNIYGYLFEQMDDTTALAIGNELYNITKIWDNRIDIKDLLVYPNYDKNVYEITIQFSIESSTEIQEIKTVIYPL